jgi:photosystem I P700 chlorophyll a apoprotein A2
MNARAAALLGAALALAPCASARAQAPDDPDSAANHARAKEALARAQRLELARERLELKGERLAIQGSGIAVEGRGQEIAGLLRDLDAEVRGKEVRIALAADVLFDFDKADLRAEARPSLEKVAAVLKSYPKAAARIEGHTDGKGDDRYNLKLSERRAESVRRFLAAHGATLRMSTRGWGEAKPLAPNTRPDGSDDPEGRQKNRRVEIVVQQL